MRLIIVDEKKLERESIARALQSTHHAIEVAADGRCALAAFAREPAQVILFVGPSSSAIELLRKVRAAQGQEHCYFVVLPESVMPGEITALYAAGVDDFMRRPFLPEELVARVDAPCRIRGYAAALLKSPAYDWSSALDVRKLRAFADTATVVAGDLAQVVGEHLDVAKGAPLDPHSPAFRCATIPMSLAADGLELQVSVVADASAMGAICRAVMGEELDEAGQLDLLRELANTAGGAVKRAYGAENVVLTTGLPVDRQAPAPGPDTRWWMLRAKEAGAIFGLACEVQQTQKGRVPASGLEEGMVITSDLRNESGALLVAAGTRLTSTSADRVRRALGPGFLVSVSRAA